MKRLIATAAVCVAALAASAADFQISCSVGGMSGSNALCPGKFTGFGNFIPPAAGAWGWKIDTNDVAHTATDTNRTDTHITWINRFGSKSGCGSNSISITNSTASDLWRFTIWFPSNAPASYTINLHGFVPVP